MAARLIKKILPAIRDFKRLRFLMTDKTVRKSVRTKTGDHSSVPCYDFTPVIEPAFDSSFLSVRSLASGIPNSHGVTGGVCEANIVRITIKKTLSSVDALRGNTRTHPEHDG